MEAVIFRNEFRMALLPAMRRIALRPGALSLIKTPPITNVKIREVFHGRIES